MDLAVFINIMIISRIIHTDSASETTPIPNIIVSTDGIGPDRVDPLIIVMIIKILFLPRLPTIVILNGTITIKPSINISVSHPPHRTRTVVTVIVDLNLYSADGSPIRKKKDSSLSTILHEG